MKRLLMMTVSGCAAAALTLMGEAPPAAGATTGPAPVAKIVYADQNGGVWIVKADGTGRHKVATATASSVSFSPDGKRIAYSAAGGIWTVPATGGSARNLTPKDPTASDVAWAPNGKWIAYAARTNSWWDVYRIPAGGGPAQRLTFGANSGCADWTPAWSPDSATIAYTRVSGGPTCTGAGVVVQRLGQTGHTVVPGFARSPSFTPAGNLVYISTCDTPDLCGDATVSYEANADGSAPLIIDPNDDCREGNLCQNLVTGAARKHGWVQLLAYVAPDNSLIETCFQGGYQKAGTLLHMPPAFCLSNVLVNGYDAA